MFAGLVEAVGTVTETAPLEGGLSLRVASPELASELAEGESVAVDGVCQTVTARDEEGFRFQAVRTTLSRTTLAEFRPGREVNLERALRAGDRIGGHFVQGHVDAVGEVREMERVGETVFLRISLPEAVEKLTAERGSLAVDGVSLTVSRLAGGVAEVAIIPYTWSHTALPRLGSGDRVNLEADLIARYLERIAAPYLNRSG
ncbi:MAG: riboflavin synthase [Gemmatimonadota bacterium]